MEQLTTFLKNFWNDEEGLETIEILLILSVLIVIAIMFKDKIMEWANKLFNDIDTEIMN
ncbi:Flp1 family type IVb pilin [Oceanobacillus sp. CFH 90083]|uniref:Flp1 family type IVb pilin n=1 Tax=Oceanobacillus sp. CFH 90083 TaxID=2592336 RepID=UPI00128E6088|nr:Flp1 family type IVb pilin [Oceanobacillus sp. CFH 90083]